MTSTIKVTMAVQKIQTLADGGTRWTFDLPEGHALESATLIVCQEQGALIDVVMTPKSREDDIEKHKSGVKY